MADLRIDRLNKSYGTAHVLSDIGLSIDNGEFVGETEDPSGDDGAFKASVLAEGLVEEGGETVAFEVVLHGSRWGRRAGDGGG